MGFYIEELIKLIYHTPFNPIVHVTGGRVVSAEVVTFWDTMKKYVTPKFTLPNDTRTLWDFPCVRLFDYFIHESETPILMYSQTLLMDAWEGVDWHALSDMFFRDRTLEWLNQLMQLIELLFLRSVDLVKKADQDLDVIDHALYRTTRVPGEEEEKEAVEIDHRMKGDDDDTKNEEEEEEEAVGVFEVGKCNHAYLYDVETTYMYLVQNIYQCRHDIELPFIQLTKPMLQTVHDLKQIIRKHMERVAEDEVVKQRRLFYESLVATDAHVRIHKRRIPYNQMPEMREVLIYKNEKIYQQHCTTVQEIFAPRPYNERVIENTSWDAMFVMFCRSIKEGDPLKPILRPLRLDIKSPSTLISEVSIRYSRLSTRWVLQVMGESTSSYSLLELFVYFRYQSLSINKVGGYQRVDTLDPLLGITHVNNEEEEEEAPLLEVNDINQNDDEE